VAVYAIDGLQETLVFSGTIINSWGIYTGMPEVYLNIESQGWYFSQITPAQRTTITADTSIVSVMEQLANNLGAVFEDNGVSGTVRAGQTLSGSYKDQAFAMAQQYRNRFTMYLDNSSASAITIGTLAISPPNVPRGGSVPIISSSTGLMDYPVFNGYGVLFDTYFNPGIKFGGSVEIQSSIPKASGIWNVNSMAHILESQTPGGQWKTTVNCWNISGSIVLPEGD
jgi:hypothetical protein